MSTANPSRARDERLDSPASPSRPSEPPERSTEELDQAIVALSRRIAADTFRLLILVREFDDRLGWAKWSFQNGSEWLAWRCGLSLSAAREKLRTAHALRRLPLISQAFAEGRVSYTKVRALTRVASRENEDLLLAFAQSSTAPQVEERCRQMRNLAPDSTELARRAWERRSLTVLRNPAAGTLTVSLELPVEDGELLVKALDKAVAAGEADLGPEFKANGFKAQQADAMVAIARAYLSGAGPGRQPTRGADAAGRDTVNGGDAASAERAGASRPVSTADHYQLVVHVDAAALHGGAGRADLPLETVKRLGCDASLIALIEDAHGNPLAIGRKQRTVSPALRRALYARDRGCTFPGCHRKHFVDAHHIEHWIHGGETNPKNLTLLCTLHHRLLHEGAFTVRRDDDGELHFERPDGRVIPRGGYRAEDMVDDLVDLGADGHATEGPGSDEWFNRVVHSTKPSMEVREQRGVYLFDRSPYDGRRQALPDTRADRSREARSVH